MKNIKITCFNTFFAVRAEDAPERTDSGIERVQVPGDDSVIASGIVVAVPDMDPIWTSANLPQGTVLPLLNDQVLFKQFSGDEWRPDPDGDVEIIFVELTDILAVVTPNEGKKGGEA